MQWEEIIVIWETYCLKIELPQLFDTELFYGSFFFLFQELYSLHHFYILWAHNNQMFYCQFYSLLYCLRDITAIFWTKVRNYGSTLQSKNIALILSDQPVKTAVFQGCSLN